MHAVDYVKRMEGKDNPFFPILHYTAPHSADGGNAPIGAGHLAGLTVNSQRQKIRD